MAWACYLLYPWLIIRFALVVIASLILTHFLHQKCVVGTSELPNYFFRYVSTYILCIVTRILFLLFSDFLKNMKTTLNCLIILLIIYIEDEWPFISLWFVEYKFAQKRVIWLRSSNVQEQLSLSLIHTWGLLNVNSFFLLLYAHYINFYKLSTIFLI